jgi:hypothetical protein
LTLGANAAHKNKYGETALDSARTALELFNTGQIVFPNIGTRS